LTGCLAEINIPAAIRPALFNFFCLLYSVNKSEIKRPLSEFHNFKDFFTRELKDNSRSFADPTNNKVICSPSDSTVLACGEVKDDSIFCVKGHNYSVGDLLYGPEFAQVSSDELFPSLKNNTLYYAVLYLSPADFHRYFSPTEILLKERCHVLGYLNPVKPKYLLRHKVILRLID
jgi:phosphatidylserine decarboxylase